MCITTHVIKNLLQKGMHHKATNFLCTATFRVLTALLMTIPTFWYMTRCRSVYRTQCFGRANGLSWRLKALPKRWYIHKNIHSFTSQTTGMFVWNLSRINESANAINFQATEANCTMVLCTTITHMEIWRNASPKTQYFKDIRKLVISKIQLKVEQTPRCLTQMKRTWECYIVRYSTVRPRTGHEDEGEQRYSSTLSLTSALDVVVGQRHGPTALPHEVYPVHIV